MPDVFCKNDKLRIPVVIFAAITIQFCNQNPRNMVLLIPFIRDAPANMRADSRVEKLFFEHGMNFNSVTADSATTLH